MQQSGGGGGSQAVFVWRYKPDEVVTWILCARLLPVHKDIAKLIAKEYLKEKRYMFDPAIGKSWSQQQLDAFKAMQAHDNVIVDVGKGHGARWCPAGIVATLLLRESNYGIHIIAADKRRANLFLEVVVELLQNRLDFHRKNPEFLHVKGSENTLMVTPSSRGPGSGCKLLIVLDANKLEHSRFFGIVVPFLQLATTKLMLFGQVSASQFLQDLEKITINTVFHVIR